MSYFAGIDLHKRYLTLCVLDPIGNVVVQHRRLTTDGLFADLVRSNLLPTIWVPDPTTRANRKLLRGYALTRSAFRSMDSWISSTSSRSASGKWPSASNNGWT